MDFDMPENYEEYDDGYDFDNDIPESL